MAFKLTDDQGHRVFGLEIQGLMTRFYMGSNPFTSASLYDLPYVDIDCIQWISSYQAEIEPSGGVGSYQPITVSLAMDRMRGSSIDPHVIFSRLSRSSSIWSGQLVDDISRLDDTPDLIVDSDPFVSYPHLLHIGSESFYCTAQSEDAGIYTITTTHRLGFRQQHAIRLGGTDTPIVSSELVSWRGRQAKIYACSVDEHGNSWDNQIIFQGIIERSPEIEGLTSVSISIAPIIAMLDNKISAGRTKTQLAHDAHYFGDIRNQISQKEIYVPTAADSLENPISVGSGLKTIDEIIDLINSRSLVYNQAKWTIFKRAGKYLLNVHGFRKGAFTEVIPILSNGGDILSQAIREHNFASLLTWGIAFKPAQISYGLDFASSLAPTHEVADARQYQIPTPDLTYRVNRFPSLEIPHEHYDDGDIPSILYEIKGFALGWRDRDEPFILVQDSLDLPTSDNGERFAIQIKREDEILTAIASHEEVVGDYFLIHLDMRKEENKKLPPFGDWIGGGPAYEISKGVLITRRPAGEVILQLLESGGGGSINGDYDLQLVGCNLDSSFINEASFLRYNSSSAISEWMFSLPADEVTLRDVLDPMLKTMGAALVMDRSSYSPKISIVLLGHEADEDQQSFSDLDFLASKPPYWTNFEDIVTQFKFIYDMQNEEPTTRIVNNYDAINRLAGETKSMELSLYGITSDLLGGTTASDFLESFLPTYARLFRLYGQAMRMWLISIGTGKALTLDLGSYLKISSDFLKAYSDSYGISQKIAMIKKISIDLMGEGAEIELIHLGDSSPTWNASAYVSSVIDSDTIAINASYFSSADASYFQVGNVVKRSTPGSDDTTTTLTISQINGNQISFTSSHGASAGDVIQPTDYTTASSNHIKRAYIDRGFKYE